MAKRAGWFARVLGLAVADDAFADRGYASYEYVDGSQLEAGEFHLSDSMRLDEVRVADFSETLPAYSHFNRPESHRVAASARMPYGPRH